MGFRPLNVRQPRPVSHEAYIAAASTPTSQLIGSVTGVGGGTAEAFDPERRTTYALVKLEASAPVDLYVPDHGGSWVYRASFATYDKDHSPLMFTDGIRIVAAAGVTFHALTVAIK